MDDITALRRVLEYSASTDNKKGQDGWPRELERRQEPRYNYKAEGTGTLTHRDEGMPIAVTPGFPVIALSLSRSGTSFLANHEFKAGDIVALELPAAAGGKKMLNVRVVRSRRVGLNACEIGAEFAETDSQDIAEP